MKEFTEDVSGDEDHHEYLMYKVASRSGFISTETMVTIALSPSQSKVPTAKP